MSLLKPEIRALLVCPKCRGELEDWPEGLYCPADRLLYPVISGIAHLITEMAKRVAKRP